MSTSDKIKALSALKGVKRAVLAEKLGMTSNALGSKLNRSTFSADDIIKIAEVLGVELSFTVNGKAIITFEPSDAVYPRRRNE